MKVKGSNNVVLNLNYSVLYPLIPSVNYSTKYVYIMHVGNQKSETVTQS